MKKQIIKGLKVIYFIVICVVVVNIVSCVSSSSEEKQDYSTEWSEMTYEERSDFLGKAIANRSFVNGYEAEVAMKKSIEKEVVNPKTISYVWRPDVYNGGARVVEADSGWIYVPFKLNAKNDFGVEKEIMGSVMFIYVSATNSLDIKSWEISQNN